MNLFSRFHRPIATVAMNLKPRAGSWGGANQWTSQLSRWLTYQGWRVRYDLKYPPDAIVMTHTGLSLGTTFGVEEIVTLKKKYPFIPCIHRINDNDLRKDSSQMDAFLAKSNRAADHTVFVSEWLQNHHGARWFDISKPHSVISPGADPRFFHPIGNRAPLPSEPLRIVTHHWSNHWNKGFDIYEQIDTWMAQENSQQYELWIIGRWPKEIQWKVARTFAPQSGKKLATLLRQCHAYISASRYEPGAMHVVEGLQCGLPLLYHPDTGGTIEQGLRYGMKLQEDIATTLKHFRDKLPELRSKLLNDPPSGCKMAMEYHQLIEKMILS